jgi:hypothetical protein
VHDRAAAAACCLEKHQTQLGTNPRTAAGLGACTLTMTLRRLRFVRVPLLQCPHCSARLLKSVERRGWASRIMLALDGDALQRMTLKQRRSVSTTHRAPPTEYLLEQLDVGLHRPLTDGRRLLSIAVSNAALSATGLVLLYVVPRERQHVPGVADYGPEDLEPHTRLPLTLGIVIEEHRAFLDKSVAQLA